MKTIEKHPMIMIVIGVLGISLSSIFVKYSQAPSAVTAAWRLLWTVLFLTPVVLGRGPVRRELGQTSRKLVLLSILSGLFLAIHFVLWFESLQHTSVASSTTIVCTEVIWVCLGFCLFLKGKLSWKAVAAITVTLLGSVLIAFPTPAMADSFTVIFWHCWRQLPWQCTPLSDGWCAENSPLRSIPIWSIRPALLCW